MLREKICVVGLGYVGLPLALEFSKKTGVVGFDINKKKVVALNAGIDATGENDLSSPDRSRIAFTSDPKMISGCDFIIVAVPTPVTEDFQPDLAPLEESSKTVGANLKRGATVVYESTVYPGATMEICKPLLEKYSGMKCGRDFSIGYSPERVNPGDKGHSLTSIVKVVSGMDRETCEKVAHVYGEIIAAGVFRVGTIETAEAAKVIENTQRDLNIALMNELSMVFEKMGLDTFDVIEAASTKWNFARFYPGMVGGHCIPVDPYYLAEKSRALGYEPKLILSGRAMNNSVPSRVARIVLEELTKAGKSHSKSTVLLLGLTFKENVKDTRNSPVTGLIAELKKKKVSILSFDPLLSGKEIRSVFRVEPLAALRTNGIDCVVVVSPHRQFSEIDFSSFNPRPIIVDIRGFFRKKIDRGAFTYRTL